MGVFCGATAIEIDRSTDGGTTWTPLTTTLSPSNTTYADTGLADNTDYTYQVRADRTGGWSAFTAATDATTVAAIDGLTATAAGTGEIDLAWTLNVTDQTKLSIYRSVDGGAYDFLTDSTVSPSLTDTCDIRGQVRL